MCHDIFADLLHALYIAVQVHRFSCKCVVGGCKDERQQVQHFTCTAPFIDIVHFTHRLAYYGSTFRTEFQCVGGKYCAIQHIPQFGKCINASQDPVVAKSCHQITYATVCICRFWCINPLVRHRWWYQRHVMCCKRLHGVTCHSIAIPMCDTVQFPCIVPMQLGFEIYFNPLVDEEKRVVFHFWQFVWYCSIVHKTGDMCINANIRQL